MHLSTRLKKDPFTRLGDWDGADSETAIQSMPKRPHPWHAQMQEIVEATTDFVAIIDGDGWLHYLNHTGRSMLGLTDSEEICGLHLEDFHLKEEAGRLLNEAFPAAHQDGAWHGESSMKTANGREIRVSQVVLAHGRPDGKTAMFSAIARDITERMHTVNELKRQATHDVLTGLPNRIVLEEHLDMELARAQRSRTHAAVILLDLDNFKRINDSLGHAAGNELLRDVALRLKSCLRSNDIIGRYGDDEFTIVVGDLHSAEHLLPVIHKLRALLEQPIAAAGQDVFAGADHPVDRPEVQARQALSRAVLIARKLPFFKHCVSSTSAQKPPLAARSLRGAAPLLEITPFGACPPFLSPSLSLSQKNTEIEISGY